MMKFSGKPVYSGSVMGNVVVLKDRQDQIHRHRVEDVENEIARVQAAMQKTAEQLKELYEKAQREGGESSAAIVEVQQMMLEDEDYLDAIYNIVRTESVNGEYAVSVTGDNFAKMFADMDDEYMRGRAADVKDISGRLVRNLSGQEDTDFACMEP
ncbi:MAG: phosphoenolpyruvate--protein phosphotransferase, partial [Acetatifactor sp.]|nr:phosphoenolpyruvate--protein phosphotransferase [Acetatifactor sp.]